MFRIILFTVFILGAWIFGDWRNWEKYYPTILYFIICSLIYCLLFYSYPLWRFEPKPLLKYILPNSTLISIVVTFIVFPATTLIYLGNYPEGKAAQAAYIALWIFIYSIIEIIALKQNAISYHNGWNIGWSLLFDLIIFSFLRLHFKKPLLTWAVSFICIAIFAVLFGLPIESMQ